MGFTNRQRVFIEEYLRCWNGSEAVKRAGYKGKPNVTAAKLLAKVSIQEVIRQRINEKAMCADEVLIRLAEHARGDMGDFLDISSMSFQVDLSGAVEKGITHLIKRVKQRTVTTLSKDGVETETHDIEIELYDAQAALVQLGRHHKLFTDNTDITTGGQPITFTVIYEDKLA